MEESKDLTKLFTEGDKPTPELQQHVQEFHDLIVKERTIKEELAKISEKRMVAEQTLYASLENANFEMIRTNDGTFSRSDLFFANIAPGRKEEGYKWLEELGYGDLIQTTVNAKTFSSFIRDLKKSDKFMELPDFINSGIKKKISVSGVKKKK